MKTVGTVLAMVAVLAGCAVGPDYRAPELLFDENWVAASDSSSADPLPDRWWSTLADPVLNELLVDAARSNPDIGIAESRVAEARALRGVARSVFWPRAGLAARHTRFEQSIESPGAAGALIEAGLVPREVDFYTALVDASWEIDVFGGNRRRAEAAGARLDAAIAQREAVRLAILAETATAYFELRGAQVRLAIAHRNIESQARTLELTQRKIDAGLARRIDELRAEAQWKAARAEVPGLNASIRASVWRLGTLTGRRPEEMPKSLQAEGELPSQPGAVPVGLRGELLRRRPDVLAAERELAAATADMGVAKADFFPRLVLSANYGFESATVSSLGDVRARTSALVPAIGLPLFQGGRLQAGVDGADARAQAAFSAYRKAVLQALADAESAITAYGEEIATYDELDAAADASIRAADIAERLYEQGLADFLTVLDAERRRNEAVDARAQSHTRLLLNLARVYKALGGGWTV